MRSESGRSILCGMALLAGLACLTALNAGAQRFLIETVTLSAPRQAARLYVQAVDMSRGEIWPSPISLPGAPALTAPLVTGDSRYAALGAHLCGAAASQTPPEAVSVATLVDTAPFREIPRPGAIGPLGWRQWPACWALDATSQAPLLVLLRARAAGDVTYGGAIAWRYSADMTAQAPPLVWPLPGAPVAAAVLNGKSKIAFLYADARSGAAKLHVRDVISGQVYAGALDAGPLTGAQAPLAPGDLLITEENNTLHLLVSETALRGGRPENHSWLIPLDTQTLESAAAPVRLPGHPQSAGRALLAADGGSYWVATADDSLGFAYLTRVVARNGALEPALELSFSVSGWPLQFALQPGAASILAGAGARLERFGLNGASEARREFSAPVGAVCWTNDGVFVGEGPRLHRVDAKSLETLETLSFQSGVVASITPLPPDPSTSGGAGGGSIPQAGAFPAVAAAPRAIVFRGQAAGREWRAIRLDTLIPAGSGGGESGASSPPWRLEYEREAMPWLEIRPTSGVLPDVMYMAIDAGALRQPNQTLEGELRVHIGAGAINQDWVVPIAVRVTPVASGPLRALWLTGGEDGSAPDLSALHDLWAASPFYASHQEAGEGPIESLVPFRVLVVTARGAARGRLTRQALVDFVDRGGALLFLGEYLGDGAEARALGPWLRPFGFEIRAEAPVNGVFRTAARDGLRRHWAGFELRGGCVVRTEDPARVVVGGSAGPDRAAFGVREYGWGRAAVLAAATPLIRESLEDPTYRLFAADLLRWLLRAGCEIEDLDGDGIPGGIEDANGNRIVDPGETDFINPDSDGDGIPDGMEDVNRSGRVDPDETDPRHPDSDGDGVWDGADPQPQPPLDAPHLVRIEPFRGAAEGGYQVLVLGRNFAADTQVWFGESVAKRLRGIGSASIIVEVPSSRLERPGRVTVRAHNPSTGLSAELLDGFQYDARSAVRFDLIVTPDTSGAAGTVAVRLGTGRNVAVGKVSLRIMPPAPGLITWADARPGELAEYARRSVASRPSPDGGVTVDVSEGARGPSSGVIAVIPWRAANGAPPAPVQFTVSAAQVLAPNGEPLDVLLGDEAETP